VWQYSFGMATTKVTFTLDAATIARLRAATRGRGREVDLAIAACALTLGARLWTLNPRDFRDIEGLDLYLPA